MVHGHTLHEGGGKSGKISDLLFPLVAMVTCTTQACMHFARGAAMDAHQQVVTSLGQNDCTYM